jgi:hypothetical protein
MAEADGINRHRQEGDLINALEESRLKNNNSHALNVG